MEALMNVKNNEVMNVKENEVKENAISVKVSTEAKQVAWKAASNCKSFATPVTINEAVEAIGADYEVKKEYLVKVPSALVESIKSGQPYAGLNLTQNDIITSHMATVREDLGNVLGVVGSKYGVVQNKKAFEFIDIITSGQLGGEQKPIIETAGILDDGARIYVTAKMPKNLYIDGEHSEGINDYILFTNTHDGTGAVTVLFTPIRVICQNTLNAALEKAQNKLIFKHTSRVGERMDWEREENMQKAVAVLQMHETFKEEFLKQLYNLKQQKVTDIDKMDFAAKIMASPAQVKLLKLANYNLDAVEELGTRTKNNINSLLNSIESGVGQNEFRGTKLWLYNGLTTYLNNDRKYKSEDDKLDSLILGGDGQKKAQKGFDILAA